jgi:transposase-like protein
MAVRVTEQSISSARSLTCSSPHGATRWRLTGSSSGPAAWHQTEQYANNRVEADHGRLKAQLRPMRGLKRDHSARVIIAGHAFVQNLRRGHYELAAEEPVNRRAAIAFAELAVTI